MKLNRNTILVLGSAALITLSGCGSSSSSSTTNNGANPQFPFDFDDECEFQDAGCYDELTPNRSASLDVTRFDGTWLRACGFAREDKTLFNETETDYVQIELIISGQTATRRVYQYENNMCTTPSTPAVIEYALEIYYAGNFDDRPEDLQSMDAYVRRAIVNLTPTTITIDGAAPTAEQQADIEARRADRTMYTILGLSTDGAGMAEGRPESEDSFSNGRSSDDRILGFFDFFYGYTRQ